jgi:hypothetical protein
MDDHSDLAPVARNTALPLEIRERARESLERKRAEFEPTGKFVTAFTHR